MSLVVTGKFLDGINLFPIQGCQVPTVAGNY